MFLQKQISTYIKSNEIQLHLGINIDVKKQYHFDMDE